MQVFTVQVTFRKSRFAGHNSAGDITGTLTIETHRCHLDAILSDFNVDTYQIVGCTSNGVTDECQLTRAPQKVPTYFYGEKTAFI
jgi:hypothetical protein